MHLPPVPVVGTHAPPFKHGLVVQNETGAAVTVTGTTVIGAAVVVVGIEVIGLTVTTEPPMLQ